MLHRKNFPHNSGDDLAGIVYSVGKNVYEFRPGDRVAALHMPGEENGSFAEYSVAPDWTTFHIPHHVSFEEAATIPVAALTAAQALYVHMRLPTPYNTRLLTEDRGKKVPILIYGVTSAVGAFAAKFARLSGLGPIIGVAGRAGDFAKTLADYVVDYRDGEDAIVVTIEGILANAGLGSKVSYIFDAISEKGSFETNIRLVDTDCGTVNTVLPPVLFAKDKEHFKYPPGVKVTHTVLPLVHSVHKDFGYLWSRYLGQLLETGKLTTHPYEVVPGGLGGVLTGLQNLRDGKASAVKYVYRINDTKEDLVKGVYGADGTSHSSESKPRGNSHPLRNFPFPAVD